MLDPDYRAGAACRSHRVTITSAPPGRTNVFDADNRTDLEGRACVCVCKYRHKFHLKEIKKKLILLSYKHYTYDVYIIIIF